MSAVQPHLYCTHYLHAQELGTHDLHVQELGTHYLHVQEPGTHYVHAQELGTELGIPAVPTTEGIKD